LGGGRKSQYNLLLHHTEITPIPSLSDLPESFGLELFNKLNPLSPIPTTFNLIQGEQLFVRVYVGGGGGIYSNFEFGIDLLSSVK
jgi:hypothetical protein